MRDATGLQPRCNPVAGTTALRLPVPLLHVPTEARQRRVVLEAEQARLPDQRVGPRIERDGGNVVGEQLVRLLEEAHARLRVERGVALLDECSRLAVAVVQVVRLAAAAPDRNEAGGIGRG